MKLYTNHTKAFSFHRKAWHVEIGRVTFAVAYLTWILEDDMPFFRIGREKHGWNKSWSIRVKHLYAGVALDYVRI